MRDPDTGAKHEAYRIRVAIRFHTRPSFDRLVWAQIEIVKDGVVQLELKLEDVSAEEGYSINREISSEPVPAELVDTLFTGNSLPVLRVTVSVRDDS